MGTSTHNKGQKGGTPLVPSWLSDPENSSENPAVQNPVPLVGPNNRFTVPRGDFTRYVNSGGRDSGSRNRSISRYVRNTMGGSSRATQRMGASRQATARLWSVANAFASGGARAVEQYLRLDGLAHKPAHEVFIAISRWICPDGGPQDEGIARDAYFSAIEDTPEIAEIQFENLTADQIMIIVRKSVVNAVYGRIVNDIGNKIILLSPEAIAVGNLEDQTKEYIDGAVKDAFAELGANVQSISYAEGSRIVDLVYQKTFDILADKGENA